MDHGPTTDARLVLRLRNPQDESAWSEFVQLYEPMIYGLVRRKGFQHADAVEVTQETLLAVLKSVDHWEPDPQRGSFRGWLATIARRLMINFLASPARRLTGTGRTSILQQLLEHPESAASLSHSAEYQVELQRRRFQWAAERIQGQFEPSTWSAFWRTSVLAEPVEVAAGELGMTPGAAYIARCRVMRRLRTEVQRQQQRDGDEEAP
jgi:RNA polymerase sigma-70 factor (ECF subfamily)